MAGRPLPRYVSLEFVDRSSAAGLLDLLEIISPLADRRHIADGSRFCFSSPVLALVTDNTTVEQRLDRAGLELGAAEAAHVRSPRADRTRAI